MKKVFALFLALLLTVGCFVFSASAAPRTVAVGGIMIPFVIDSSWYVSTPDNINAHFMDGNDLPETYFQEYMQTFHYCLWLKSSKSSDEIKLICEDVATGKPDYAAMSDSALASEARSARYLLEIDDVLSVSRTDRFRSGNVLFLRYEVLAANKVFAVFYETVVDGRAYELRLTSGDDFVHDTSITQQDILVNDLAAALTFPDGYPTAPQTTAATVDAELNISTGEIRTHALASATTAPVVVDGQSTATSAQGVSDEPGSTAAPPEQITVSMGEYTPASRTRGNFPWGAIIGGIAGIAVLAAAVVIAKKRHKS
ncbi:MAG: hypothetical protein IJ766_07595 [Clostridia bacterium]|nr:hypothetical protein [Clostridia bacterium]